MKENLSKIKYIFRKYSDVILRSNEVTNGGLILSSMLRHETE